MFFNWTWDMNERSSTSVVQCDTEMQNASAFPHSEFWARGKVRIVGKLSIGPPPFPGRKWHNVIKQNFSHFWYFMLLLYIFL